MPCALAPGRTLSVLVVSGGETLVLEVKSPCRRAPLRQLKLHLSPIVLGVVLVGALHETGGADGVGHVAVVVPTARVPGVSFRVDQDGRQLRARQALLVPVPVADAEERRLVAHRCSHEELPSERFADPRDADQGAGHPAPRDILGADAGEALRLAGSRGPLGGLSQHTGGASGGTHRLSSLRGRPEHRLGGTRQARCRRSGVCFRRTVRASQSATVWDSSATSSRSRTRAQTGRHETGSVQAQWCLLPAHSPGVPQLWAEHSVGLIGGPPRGAGTETPAGVTFVSLRMLDFRRELERALHEGREGVRGERPLSQARRSPPATGRAGSRDRSFGLATKRPKVRALESSP